MYAVSLLALDRGSVRSFDEDGRLHVAVANISKACVNPYNGNEIPNWERLGLDSKRTYQMLRDPKELAKAASTFNNLPILSRHVPVSATAHRPDLVIGSTGTDTRFAMPYLQNSLVIWAQEFIDKIESGKQRALSAAYHYDPVMVAGDFQGVRFAGRMTNLRGNHIITCDEGRAGSDVVVGDARLSTRRRPFPDYLALFPDARRLL